MSSYYYDAYDPIKQVIRKAYWMDDYFGRHRYGVQFDENGPVYKVNEVMPPRLGQKPKG